MFDYYTMERDATGTRRVDPYQLLFQGGQFYLVGRAHDRDAIRVFRLSAGCSARSGTRPRPSMTSSAPRTSTRVPTPTASPGSSGIRAGPPRSGSSHRIAWQIERSFGRYGEMRPADEPDDRVFVTGYAGSGS